MKTFNGKPWYRNVIAVILGFIGLHFLGKAWLYHILVQLVTMPKTEWLNPFERCYWVVRDDYPNSFCYFFCNIEATMIHQLHLLRVGYGTDYCKEPKG